MKFKRLFGADCPICNKKREDMSYKDWDHIKDCYINVLGYSPFESFEISSKLWFLNQIKLLNKRKKKVQTP